MGQLMSHNMKTSSVWTFRLVSCWFLLNTGHFAHGIIGSGPVQTFGWGCHRPQRTLPPPFPLACSSHDHPPPNPKLDGLPGFSCHHENNGCVHITILKLGQLALIFPRLASWFLKPSGNPWLVVWIGWLGDLNPWIL